MKKKWTPDAALVAKNKLDKEDETHADGVDLKQLAWTGRIFRERRKQERS